MIISPWYIVTGYMRIDDDVIFTHRLQFLGPKSKLVIVPKKDAKADAKRMLKIVADTIDTIAGTDCEITYDLDNSDLIPPSPITGDLGLDPETKAGKGRDGSPNYSHGIAGLLPDTAEPNFDQSILGPEGAYPKAEDGGEGQPGGKGGKGIRGMDGPIVEIWTKEIVGNGFTIDLRGQEGGDGGKGGNGQYGGNGQKGSNAVPGTGETWIGMPTARCVRAPGLGGDGGKGGNAGCGGDGGDGGNGGAVNLFYTSSVDRTKITCTFQKGKGGSTGTGGTPGKGGKAGPPGFNLPPCVQALPARTDGPDGISCPSDKERAVSQPGRDGLDGAYSEYPVKDIPKIPGLWP